MFTLIHGVFLFSLVSGAFTGQAMPPVNIGPLLLLWAIAGVVQVVAMLIRPAPTAPLKQQMGAPYKRVIPLHLTLILGAFAATLFNAPASALSILVAVKLVVDIAHYKSLRATRA